MQTYTTHTVYHDYPAAFFVLIGFCGPHCNFSTFGKSPPPTRNGKNFCCISRLYIFNQLLSLSLLGRSDFANSKLLLSRVSHDNTQNLIIACQKGTSPRGRAFREMTGQPVYTRAIRKMPGLCVKQATYAKYEAKGEGQKNREGVFRRRRRRALQSERRRKREAPPRREREKRGGLRFHHLIAAAAACLVIHTRRRGELSPAV